MKTAIINDVDKAIFVMRDAGKWLLDTDKKPSKWWQLKNLNRKFLFNYAKPDEFFVVLAGGKPAAAAILQINQSAQNWNTIDKGKPQSALYIHWLCVHRNFSGTGMPNILIDFAEKYTKKHKIQLLRVDTNAEEIKLKTIYENFGFKLKGIEQEDYRRTAFYQKRIYNKTKEEDI